MAVHLCFFLIISALTGIHSITTVSKVPVKAGDPVSIPCLYGSQYVNHVKYLCRGYYWNHCSYAVKTNRENSGNFLISDDKIHRIFTVTIKGPKDKDYWCAVEVNGGSDDGAYFHLSLTSGKPSLYVDRQEMTGFIGDNITISCHYRNSVVTDIKWCRLGSSCVTSSSGSIHGTRVTVIRSVPNVYNVTMSGLKTESSGWYYCVKGDLQVPVHLTVNEKNTTNQTLSTGQGKQRSDAFLFAYNYSTVLECLNKSVHFNPFALCTLNVYSRSPGDLTHLIIPLGLLIFIAMVALFIWFMLRRYKQTKAESLARTTAKEEVTYNTVKRSDVKSDEDVTYSSVVTVQHQTV
ncbi:uncharacterized protein LOC121954635 isoform X2 [Plectropomus leopardus]|uniref:uncharacterized protein LOC121954635 isoform X2 n=1 Tax=Plectropomus leopardus TaxID=160734 RepID=UPI001C4C23DA|nr:uncharacterized protein LOC121954635 isoform X2 [Plectropomus leopardus]